jgi:CheY-like chemotaxis protein
MSGDSLDLLKPFLPGLEAALDDPDVSEIMFRTQQPDLVLLDLLLPGPDGIELLERLPALADRPVIVLSGYGRDETMPRALPDRGAPH